jgi:hypothetical protein
MISSLASVTLVQGQKAQNTWKGLSIRDLTSGLVWFRFGIDDYDRNSA